VLPLASIVFLGYIAIKSILSASAAQNYSLLGFLVVGLILLLVARFVWRSPFRHQAGELDAGKQLTAPRPIRSAGARRA
jgi:hypothetical protein